MTQEEKAKAYDEAIDKVAHFIKKHIGLGCIIHPNSSEAKELFNIFPEIAGSKDERIRKGIIDFLWKEKIFLQEVHSSVENCPKYHFVMDAIAWLEKQGEQKPFDYENANIQQKDFAPKVEPKFKNGQWIVWQDKCYKVNYNGCGYELVDQNGLSTSLEYGTVDENAHLWTIRDAKDGDVLVSKSPFIYGKQCPYGGLNWNNNNFIKASNFIFTDSPVHPATKEQRDLLFQKMHEAGYEWDVKNRELKKIEQKPAWSEEDKNFMYDTLSNLTELKDRYGEGYGNVGKCIKWLKSIRERYARKPSDEQRKVCKEVYADLLSAKGFDIGTVNKELNRMEEQLKKLKEE